MCEKLLMHQFYKYAWDVESTENIFRTARLPMPRIDLAPRSECYRWLACLGGRQGPVTSFERSVLHELSSSLVESSRPQILTDLLTNAAHISDTACLWHNDYRPETIER